jgi:glycosyltransferase involved in cell wall biosynthesis
LRTAWLSLRVHRRHGFDILQACNPPDTYWLLAALWRPFGVKFVYDQHDLNPELFRSRFGEPTHLLSRLQLATLEWLERMTYRTAHHVISTNESYRQIAIGRGARKPDDVTVVRSGPDTSVMRPVRPRPELRRGADHLLVYIGIMGPQDCVDVLVYVMDELVNRQGRGNLHLALLGYGDCEHELKRLTAELGLEEVITFTGTADRVMIADYLSSADLGLCPDLKTPLNDVSTHNKIMEYMAHALPTISFNLVENQISAMDCAVYVPSGDIAGYASAVTTLLDDPAGRVRMASRARARCVTRLDWEPQAAEYVRTYDLVAGIVREAATPSPGAVDGRVERRHVSRPLPDIGGRPVIDLRDPADFEQFLRARGVLRVTEGGADPDSRDTVLVD